MAREREPIPQIPSWYWFFDFHTMPACPDVGAAFDAEALAERLKDCGVDYISFPARCNLGVAYYDTRLGIRHPSLRYDLLGRLLKACHARDIRVAAYINVGLSHEEGLRHRDWLVLTAEGYVYKPDRLNHFFRMMCYNTGYGPHVLAMIEELVRGWPVDGLFLDCMRQPPCVGLECMQEMKERGVNWQDRRALEEFARFSRVRMARRIAETARGLRPDLLLYFNGVDCVDQLDLCTHLEYECLPTGGWGYEARPVYARYLRTLGKAVFNMTGRFHESWGDFGGIRTQASLEYDCYDGLAQGMRVCVGDHFHPRGEINPAVMDLVGRVLRNMKPLEPWTEAAVPLSDAAVVAPPGGLRSTHEDEYKRNLSALQGATRMLAELKQQFDVVSEESASPSYKLLVLPDHVLLSGGLRARVQAHLAAGGAVIATAWSGLDPQQREFVFPEWGVAFDGEDPFDPAYLLAGPELAAHSTMPRSPLSDLERAEGLPAMPITLYERGAAVRTRRGTTVLAHVGAPYYNRHWDGEHSFLYLPPDRPTDRPAVTLFGRVAYATHPLFAIYHRHAPVPMRAILAGLIRRLLPKPLLKTTGLPSFARATVTCQPRRRMVHLLSYVPERRGPNIEMIEEPIHLRDVSVALRVDRRRPKRVYLAPARQELPFKIAHGYAQVTVPAVPGYALVVFEE